METITIYTTSSGTYQVKGYLSLGFSQFNKKKNKKKVK